MMNAIKVLFRLGAIVATPNAHEVLDRAGIKPEVLLYRHMTGDWGDLCEEDKTLNEYALMEDARIFSAYNLTDEDRIWVITEADRSVTTLLLPEDY